MLRHASLLSLVLLIGSSLNASPINLSHMLPVGQGGPCLSILGGDTQDSSNCVSFTRRETAGPTYDAKRQLIYIGGADAALHVISLATQKVIRKIKLPGNLLARPLLDGDILYLGTDNGFVVSLDLHDFSISWKILLDAEIDETLVLDEGILYCVTGLSTLYALHTTGGEEERVKWIKKRLLPSSITLDIQSRPLIFRDQSAIKRPFLVVGSPSGSLEYYDLDSGVLLRDIVLANAKEPFPDVATDPIVFDGAIVAASYNGGIYAFDPFTGTRLWHLEKKGVSRLAAEGSYLFAAGKEFALGLTKASLPLPVWEFHFTAGSSTRLITTQDGRLIFASDRNALYVLSANTGALMQLLGSSLGIAGNMDWGGGMLYAVSTAGWLMAYRDGFEGVVQKGRQGFDSFPLF